MEFMREFFYDEVQEGFYVPGIIKRAWGAQLKVLGEIDKVCKKYDIQYQIYAGTLLGAVRYGAYIPWDDDVDIIMLPEEFEKFCQVAHELPKELLFTYTGNNEDACKFCGVVEFDGIQIERDILNKYCEFPYPTSVDIFYLGELSDNPEDEEYRKNLLRMLGLVMYYGLQKGVNGKAFQQKLKKIENLLQIHLDREKPIIPQIYRVFNKVCQEFNGSGCEEVALLQYHIHKQNRYAYPKSLFQKTKEILFCGLELPAPEDFDKVLQLTYGDYKKTVKGTAAHEYPFFKEWEKIFWRAKKGITIGSVEEEKRRKEIITYREFSLREADKLLHLNKDIFIAFSTKEFPACFSMLYEAQEEAIQFGQAIERIKGEGAKSVSILERYCEALYTANQALNELMNCRYGDEKELNKVEKKRKEIEAERMMRRVRNSLKKLHSTLKKEFKFKVVFLPHRVKYLSSLSPLIDALLQKEDTECMIMPIPYFDRLGDGRLSEMHYEGDDFEKYYEITDYRSYDFEKELPDAIVLNSPYDDFNQVWTVDPFFYSKEMRKFTKKLIYIPWFVTDEIDPKKNEDKVAFANMDYYALMPGVFYADLTIVQSKEMRKAYLMKISEFMNKEIRKKMTKKISGAGSCLFGDKEGKGIKEVVAEFRRFLLKV